MESKNEAYKSMYKDKVLKVGKEMERERERERGKETEIERKRERQIYEMV